jgi:hypothetical protein
MGHISETNGLEARQWIDEKWKLFDQKPVFFFYKKSVAL